MSDIAHRLREGAKHYAAEGDMGLEALLTSAAEEIERTREELARGSRPLQRHFVEFLSPGTFVSEVTSREVGEWSVEHAVEMAGSIVARHGARPYAFRFLTRSHAADELDAKTSRRRGLYYLGGTVKTAAEILAGTAPDEKVLRANVEALNDPGRRVVVNDNSWRFTALLEEDDVVLDVTLPPLPSA